MKQPGDWTLTVKYDVDGPGRRSRVVFGSVEDLMLHLDHTKSWEKGAKIFLKRIP